jgi:hypothetical protein
VGVVGGGVVGVDAHTRHPSGQVRGGLLQARGACLPLEVVNGCRLAALKRMLVL